MRVSLLLLIFFILQFLACSRPEKADMIIYNANIYTVNPDNPKADFVAIKNGLIWKIGSGNHQPYISDNTEVINADGRFVMPGWIEGHGHFSSLGKSLQNLNFIDAKNWDEIVDAVKQKTKHLPKGAWIEGRGWHQEKWDKNPDSRTDGYPIHNLLSESSPENPVVLYHASGHSLYANKAAMDAAGVSIETKDPSGGHIVRDLNGEPIGVFEENAMTFVSNALGQYRNQLDQEELNKIWIEGINLAEEECLKYGITSFQDAGSKFHQIEAYRKMAENEELDIRLWAMLRHSAEEMKGKIANYRTVGVGNNFFTCAAIKSEVDGALGAHGAWLLKPYEDKPNHIGQNTTPISEVKDIAQIALDNNMQLCVHAIGDRANRVVVDIYEGMLSKVDDGNARRWRVEHAQHVDPIDIPRFHKNGIIASMQGVHCTSDAPFVEKRLGKERAKNGAYAWRSFLDADVLVANGTDAPIENVNPIPSFYASVTRKRSDTGMEFYPEQSMTREEAIYSYTLGNAYAAFEEDIKGSLEMGKVADIAIMTNDLINCSDEEILNTQVFMTIVDGNIKYQSKR